jgi:hypothetical protein
VVKTLHSFLFKSFLGTVKYNCHLLVASLLVESLWPSWETSCAVRSAVVLAWAWDFKFETLAKEDLVEVETRRRGVETYFFACRLFEV